MENQNISQIILRFLTYRAGNGQREGEGPPVPTSVKIQ